MLFLEGHGKSMVDGLHGEPIRQIKLMDENSMGRSIDEVIQLDW